MNLDADQNPKFRRNALQRFSLQKLLVTFNHVPYRYENLLISNNVIMLGHEFLKNMILFVTLES